LAKINRFSPGFGHIGAIGLEHSGPEEKAALAA
jgi:hypothetical protein